VIGNQSLSYRALNYLPANNVASLLRLVCIFRQLREFSESAINFDGRTTKNINQLSFFLLLLLLLFFSSSSSPSMALRYVSASRPPRCQCFETTDFCVVGMSAPRPTPNLERQGVSLLSGTSLTTSPAWVALPQVGLPPA
jgi:hypothetical protein